MQSVVGKENIRLKMDKTPVTDSLPKEGYQKNCTDSKMGAPLSLAGLLLPFSMDTVPSGHQSIDSLSELLLPHIHRMIDVSMGRTA